MRTRLPLRPGTTAYCSPVVLLPVLTQIQDRRGATSGRFRGRRREVNVDPATLRGVSITFLDRGPTKFLAVARLVLSSCGEGPVIHLWRKTDRSL